MKKNKIWIVGVLILAMVLSACAPMDVPVDPIEKPYPIDETEDNAGGAVTIPYPIDTIPSEEEAEKPELPVPVDLNVSEEDLQEHAEDLNEFAIDLYRRLAAEEGNLIYSPYSIYQAFLMVYAGADGATKAEIAEALELDLEDGEDVHQFAAALNRVLTTRPEYLQNDAQPLVFTIANALWLQEDFQVEQAFLDQLTENYQAGLQLVDFSEPEEARQAINLWVAAQTNDKIKDLIPEGVLNALTRLVISNAVYFKGAWRNQFDAGQTLVEPFYLLDGSETEVEMMHNSFTGHGLVTDRYQAVTLPYEGGNFAMTVIMPVGDFSAFEQNLDEDFDDIQKALQGSASIQLSLPKFKTESSFALANQLKALGMIKAFDSGDADFSKISNQTDLYISDVLHKAFIEVNEEGTEAAAATAISVGTTSLPVENYEITFDHPFIYLIHETTTNAILFMGRVLVP
jgi:serpin B